MIDHYFSSQVADFTMNKEIRLFLRHSYSSCHHLKRQINRSLPSALSSRTFFDDKKKDLVINNERDECHPITNLICRGNNKLEGTNIIEKHRGVRFDSGDVNDDGYYGRNVTIDLANEKLSRNRRRHRRQICAPVLNLLENRFSEFYRPEFWDSVKTQLVDPRKSYAAFINGFSPHALDAQRQ